MNGKDMGNSSYAIPTTSGRWHYNTNSDYVAIYYDADDINSVLIEKGTNWNNLLDDVILKSSRFFDSRVNGNIERTQFRDKNGEFDYIVIRTTALIACKFLIMGQDPDSPSLLAFDEEINFNVGLINSGETKLSHQVTPDSSKGVVTIKQLNTPDRCINLVDTRGTFTGIYDLIKIICTKEGDIGTAEVDIYTGNSTTGIKSVLSLSEQLVTGLYQTIGSGLQVRFQNTMSTNIMKVNDEWEIECFGKGEEIADLGYNSIKSTRITRGGIGVYN